jgi:hypothetical protein
MRQVVRWGFAIFATVLLWRAGISILRSPVHEVLYSTGSAPRTCVPAICTTMMTLEVGNTGTADQENVRVRLRAEPLRNLQLPLKVRNFGKVDRAVKLSEVDGQRVYDLGRLEPQKRVEFQIVFFGPADAKHPAWSDILVGIEPTTGEAVPGDPGLVLFARMMHAFFGWL